MSLVNVLKVSLCFVEREIFHEIGFQVEPGDRIGLVGPNGSGKTSLLRLLVNEITPDSGEVRMARGIRVGYLPQDVQENLQGPLLPTVLSSIPDRVRLESALARVQERLEAARDREEQSRLARELAGIHQEIADLDREFPPHEAERILAGLGFAPSRFDDPISSLSGGWKMRAALACRLYQRPDLLLLDEPTNHLDIPTVRWLEEFLENFKGAIILVAHDRDFLNRQV
ncbi:MAG: ABC transporter ATP-binding protein, partial [Deltaproteobacteria bacterium]